MSSADILSLDLLMMLERRPHNKKPAHASFWKTSSLSAHSSYELCGLTHYKSVIYKWYLP